MDTRRWTKWEKRNERNERICWEIWEASHKILHLQMCAYLTVTYLSCEYTGWYTVVPNWKSILLVTLIQHYWKFIQGPPCESLTIRIHSHQRIFSFCNDCDNISFFSALSNSIVLVAAEELDDYAFGFLWRETVPLLLTHVLLYSNALKDKNCNLAISLF